MTHIFRSAALLFFVLALGLVTPALAEGDAKSKAPGAATANPEANAINQRNPHVIHAGPGKPTVGERHVPAGEAGKGKKSGGH